LDFRRFSQNSAFGAILKPNEYSSSYVALNWSQTFFYYMCT
jgi:hypothetical protein